MKSNKSKKVFIIIIIVIVVLLIAGIAYAFLAPSLFKGNKDYFFECISQIIDEENGFIDNKISEYDTKKNSSAYQNEGEITFNIESEELDTDTLKNANNLSIDYAGRIDNVDDKAEETIKINYTDEINFPIEYKKAYGNIGLKFSELSKRYFGVKDSDLKQLLSGIGSMTAASSITSYSGDDMTETETVDEELTGESNQFNINFTSEEKSRLKDMYLAEIKNILDESDFSKVSASDSEGYTLALSNEKLKSIILKVLEILKDDNVMLNKISKIIGTDVAPVAIENIRNQIEQYVNLGEGTTNITVYETDKKLNKIEMQFNDQFKLTISKTSTDDETSYTFDIENQTSSISVNVKYSGLKSLEEVTENYEVILNMGEYGSYTYNIENKANFINSEIQIDDYDKNEFVDINDLDDEKRNQILGTLWNGILESNTEKIQEAEILGANPLLTIIPIAGYNELSTLNKYISNPIEDTEDTEEKDDIESNSDESANTTNTVTGTENTISSETETNTVASGSETYTVGGSNTTVNTNTTNTSSNSSLVNSMEKTVKESFNQKFSQYEGENVKGVTVKSLIMQVIASNMADEERQIEVTGDVVLTGDNIPETLVTSKFYKVKCTGYDADGYINKIEITEKK